MCWGGEIARWWEVWCKVMLREYRRGRITRDYRRWGRLARLARFRARSHSRNAYGGGQTGSFPFSEVSSHYEPSESCETNIRKRPVCPGVPEFINMTVPNIKRRMNFIGTPIAGNS